MVSRRSLRYSGIDSLINMKRLISKVRGYAGNPLIKNSAIMFAGTMGANVIAYLYHLVIGRILGPVGYGELAALISIYYILNAPSAILQNILVKFFSQLKAKEENGQAKRLFSTITKYIGIFAIVTILVLIPLSSMAAAFLNIKEPIYLIWLYLTFISYLFSVVSISMLQAYQQFISMAVVSNGSGALRLILGVAGSFFGVGWTLLSGVISNIAGYVMTLIPLRNKLAHAEKKLSISTSAALYYSIPAFIAVSAMTALYSQDVVLVKHFFNAQSAGIYSSLSVLGKIIFFASSSIGLVAFPTLAERIELKKSYDNIVYLSLLIVAAVSFGLTAIYYMFPTVVVNLLFGKAFMSASIYLGPFGLFISFYTLANLFITMYLALGKTNVWVVTAIGAFSQMIVINMYHNDLMTVIRNNTIIVGGLFILLLLYYPYAKRKN
jgi:O-antigen/teichoic acid export membrane protein